MALITKEMIRCISNKDKQVYFKNSKGEICPLSNHFYEVDNIYVLFKSENEEAITVREMRHCLNNNCFTEDDDLCDEFDFAICENTIWGDEETGFNSLLQVVSMIEGQNQVIISTEKFEISE